MLILRLAVPAVLLVALVGAVWLWRRRASSKASSRPRRRIYLGIIEKTVPFARAAPELLTRARLGMLAPSAALERRRRTTVRKDYGAGRLPVRAADAGGGRSVSTNK
jgi:hypothetical protein